MTAHRLMTGTQRYSDLIDLYQGKRMHEKALTLLRQYELLSFASGYRKTAYFDVPSRLAQNEEDKLDRLDPTVRYLQKLGPDHLDLIFSESDWIFKEDPAFGLRVSFIIRGSSPTVSSPFKFQIFTADEAEVEALPRYRVLKYLEETDEASCRGYLEHITGELGEAGPDFHDKLAELYLKSARRQYDDPDCKLCPQLSFNRHLRSVSYRWRSPAAAIPQDFRAIQTRPLARQNAIRRCAQSKSICRS